MAKHYEPGDPGDADAAANRERPPLTHREVPADEIQAERDRAIQNDLGTRPGDLDSGDRLPRAEHAEEPAPAPKPRRRSAAKKKT
jgi:hypothetical protein